MVCSRLPALGREFNHPRGRHRDDTTMKPAAGLFGLVIFTASAGALPPVAAGAEAAPSNVARVAEPLVKPALLPPAPGAVEPRGWLRIGRWPPRTASRGISTSGTRPSATAGRASPSRPPAPSSTGSVVPGQWRQTHPRRPGHKAYADYPAAMGHLEFTDVSGLCNVDAALETYSYSGGKLKRGHLMFTATLMLLLQRTSGTCRNQLARKTIIRLATARREGHLLVGRQVPLGLVIGDVPV